MRAKLKPIVIVAVLLCSGLAIIALVRFSSYSKETAVITYDFDTQTGDVQLNPDSGFELYDVTLEYGNYNQPQYSENSTTVVFNAFELPLKKSEFITVRCKQIGSDPARIVSVTYEVLHQSETEIIISRYENSILTDTKTYLVAS